MAKRHSKETAWMWGLCLHPWSFVLCTVLALQGAVKSLAANCTADDPLVGFQADLSMLQRQLRGTINIIDDCTFKVAGLDMLPGTDVYWWGSLGPSLDEMLGGRPIAATPLVGPYNSATFEVTLDVDHNTTWSMLGVLAVWDRATASDFGHIILELETPPPPPPAPPPPSLAPGPALEPSLGPAEAPSGAPLPAPPAPPPLPPALPKRGVPQLSMFDNCVALSAKLRVRWTLDVGQNSLEIGLEGAVDPSQYIAFGWADPRAKDRLMGGADIAVAGFDEKGTPFVEDYFISGYSECSLEGGKVQGVCPDDLLAGDSAAGAGVSNTELVTAWRRDGVSFFRYRRPLVSPDLKYDHSINETLIMNVIWATGSLRRLDAKSPRLIPLFHGGSELYASKYGDITLSVGARERGCSGPLTSSLPDLGAVLVADRGASLTVSAGDAHSYPNPPNRSRVLYLNNEETPVLKVFRGVPVSFSIVAGYSFPFYITSDPVGGHLNKSELIHAGGPEAEGVPTAPYAMTWTPNTSTPNLVYYQVFSQPKMGWRVEVEDGSLSDMYSNLVLLADKGVTLGWSLGATDIQFAVRGERPSNWLAVAFGSGMVNAWAYVAWFEDGVGRVDSYWMDGRNPESVHLVEGGLEDVKVEQSEGRITFEFKRALRPEECNVRCNVIDPEASLKVVWAAGDSWSAGPLSPLNQHSVHSSSRTLIRLREGNATVERLPPVFAVHGFIMFLAWGMLVPGGVLAARYLKEFLPAPRNDWFQVHIYAQVSGMVVIALGLLFAVGELRGFSMRSLHARIGITAITLAFWQPVNAYVRPPKAPPGELPSTTRVLWQWTHRWSGRIAVVLGLVSQVTGLLELGKQGGKSIGGLLAGLFAWTALLGLIVVYNEYRFFRGPSHIGYGKAEDGLSGSQFVNAHMGDEEEVESMQMLSPHRLEVDRSRNIESDHHGRTQTLGVEIQLEAFR